MCGIGERPALRMGGGSRLTAALFLLFWASWLAPGGPLRAAAQTADIRGVVVDRSTGTPIGGAVVVLEGSALQAVTDDQGRFRLVNDDRPGDPNFGVPLAPGMYSLVARAKGYQPERIERVEVSGPGDVLHFEFGMAKGHRTNFVEVGPSGRYFALEDGTPYIPAGFHHQIVEPDFNYAWSPYGKRGSWWPYHPSRAEAFARALPELGVTMIRIFLEEAYILETNLRWALFQDPVGVYNPDVVAHWDQLFDWADQHGLKILVSLYHTDQAQRNWRNYPYAARQGGPAGEAPDERWFTSPEVREAQKRDFAYVIDRWGQRDSFFALDLMNEADGWPGARRHLGQWIDEMAAFVRERMVDRWGKAHLLTVSTAHYAAEGHLTSVLNHPQLDFATTHMYWAYIANPQVRVNGVIKTDVTAPAFQAHFAAKTVLSRMNPAKPYFDSEHGPIAAELPLDRHFLVDGRPSPAADEAYFHNIIWANFVAGAAGVPTRWGFRPDTPLGYRLTDEMLADIGRLVRFGSLFDLATYDPAPVDVFQTSASRDDLAVVGSFDQRQAMYWALQRRAPIPDGEPEPIEGASVTVRVAGPGAYRVTFYDTKSGAVGPERTAVAAGDALTVELPRFLLDIAFKLEKVD